MLYTQLNQTDKAIQDYSSLIQLNSGNVQAYLNRGILYNQLKQTEKAKNDF
ncbi:MAG: tetratricopeptide repeat protein [Bacteroidota bacterium]|nr:MAG: tetratricopeptide repeat protein [Bacteroidota bacterium]